VLRITPVFYRKGEEIYTLVGEDVTAFEVEKNRLRQNDITKKRIEKFRKNKQKGRK